VSDRASVQKQGPYLALAGALLVLALLFAFARLPKIEHADDGAVQLGQRHQDLGAGASAPADGGDRHLPVRRRRSQHRQLPDQLHRRAAHRRPDAGGAAHYVSYYWGGAMVGRFIGFAVMRYVSPGKTLAFNAAVRSR
jgi:FHS family L-fucose permease-like MFS transporter